jgi:hypothetical protein
VRFTAVCSRWRAVAIQNPLFWTQINVHLIFLYQRQVRARLYMTDAFLSRIGNFPLDVEIHVNGGRMGDAVPLFIALFQEKGSFHRWKTLSLDVREKVPEGLGEIQQTYALSQLEHLTLVSKPPATYFDFISNAVTSNLHTLELGACYDAPVDFHRVYGKILERVKTIHIWSPVALMAVELPPNIKTVRAYTLPNVPIPQIKHIYLKYLNLAHLALLNPSNLVTLLVRDSVSDFPAELKVELPNLLWLALKKKSFPALSALETPNLHTLTIENVDLSEQRPNGRLVTALRGLQVDKLLMLFINVRLNWEATIEVLRLFPALARLELHCHNAEVAQTILALVGEKNNYNMCPDMDVIRIILDSPPNDLVVWKRCVREMARRIGDSFWRLESSWPGGKYFREVGTGMRKKVPFIYPWCTEGE